MSRLVETSVDRHVALCRLNRPEARNALSPELMEELATEVERFDADVIEALAEVGEDVFGRIAIVERVFGASGPAAILRGHFCGDIKFFVRPADCGATFRVA